MKISAVRTFKVTGTMEYPGEFWEERLIREALERTEGNVPDAAQLLGISRATAYRKIAEYEILR